MKSFPFIVFIFLTSLVFAQPRKDVQRTSVELLYGQKFLAHPSFNHAFNTLDNIQYGGNISYVGVGVSGSVSPDRWFFSHYGSYYYTQVVPQSIKVNDTITNQITGFNFGFTYFGVSLIPRKKFFDVFVTLGANTGRLRMYGNHYTTQKNPYFSPKIRIHPALTFRNFRISLQIEYEYDISRKNWRHTTFFKGDKLNLAKTSNTGLTIFAGIGYVIDGTGKGNGGFVGF